MGRILQVIDRLRNITLAESLQFSMFLVLFLTWVLADLVLKRTKKNVVRYIGQYFGPIIALSLFMPPMFFASINDKPWEIDDILRAASWIVATLGCWVALLNIFTWKIVIHDDGVERFRYFSRKKVKWDDIRRMRYNKWLHNIVCDLKGGGKLVVTIHTHNLRSLLHAAAFAGVRAEGFELPKADTFD